MTTASESSVPSRILHVIVPQREGAIGGADLHVLDLAAAQQRAGTYRPLILTPRAPHDYLQRLRSADLEALSPGLLHVERYPSAPPALLARPVLRQTRPGTDRQCRPARSPALR